MTGQLPVTEKLRIFYEKITTWCGTERSVWLLLPLIIVIGGLWRIYRHFSEPLLSRDGMLYISMAGRWAEHSWAFASSGGKEWIPPFYIWLLSLAVKSGLDAYTAGIVINIMLGTFLIAVFYWFGREVTGSLGWGLIAALLGAFVPKLVGLSIEVQRECAYLFFYGLSICFTISCIRKFGIIKIFLSGFFLSVAFSSRYEAVEFAGVLILYWLIMCLGKLENKGKVLFALLGFFVGFSAGLLLLIELMQLPYMDYYVALGNRIGTMFVW